MDAEAATESGVVLAEMAHSSRVCMGTLDVRDGALSFLGFLQAPVVEAWSLFWHAHLFLVGQKA